MTNSIVTINVFQTIAPAPSTLQRSGAFISQGGTTGTVGSLSLLTQLSDLTPLQPAAKALTTLSWASGVVTATAAVAHGYTIGQQIPITIAGAAPIGYNGTFLATVTTTTAFTYPVASNPGSMTTPGTYTPGSVSELLAMATTFFAQGSSVSVWVLELGAGSATAGVAALTTFITNNPRTIYSYLVPAFWDANSAYIAFLANYTSTTALTYFFTQTTDATRSNYTALMKCVFLGIEAPAAPATEFMLASDFWVTLHANPSSTNKVAPLAFSYIFGVTPYPTVGSGVLFNNWKTQGVNWVGQGSEGGITNTIIYWGTTGDARPWNYWYSVDWMQINVALSAANEIINGSNNAINPLYLNQDGINRVQSRIAATARSAVTFGLALGDVVQTELNGPDFAEALENGAFAGQVVVNAVPFVDYYKANESDYRFGIYNGYSITYTPLRGFESITINIDVTDFVTA